MKPTASQKGKKMEFGTIDPIDGCTKGAQLLNIKKGNIALSLVIFAE